MSRNDLEELSSAIEDSARLIGAPFSRDQVWPVLTAYGDAVPNAMIAFRVATDARHEGELDCRISLPADADPYGVAVAENFVTETGHPIDSLLADIAKRCPIDSYGIDFGVVGGFKKIWAFFPQGDFQSLARLIDAPSMPAALAGNAEYFARHGLDDRIGLVGIDYDRRTLNVYFGELPEECLQRDNLLAMHREIGLTDPSEQMLRFCAHAFGIYATLSWDSAQVVRLAFSVMTPDPLALPARLGPRITHFVRNVRYGVDDPKMVHAAVTSTGEEYYKLQSYYRYRPHMVNLESSPDAGAELA
ncbi:aromatic prenyltransferase [Micromonospora endophytica]|uniref:Prenyltransferase n=1 Tax=Micromonospora endophytica TaxID=515350 RepID=A0A2W2DID6_9ACTN|nr:aromatic prenyltransferase [Micromonospora endophytica]PZG00550.1 prenyltransferase [Micromonospora endophytica]RIW45817.1 prenyltransferase [Micromonospora endophytica]BCJ61934.1 hypothetical protein Jiend_53560 [Micromonospora endophytica]